MSAPAAPPAPPGDDGEYFILAYVHLSPSHLVVIKPPLFLAPSDFDEVERNMDF